MKDFYTIIDIALDLGLTREAVRLRITSRKLIADTDFIKTGPATSSIIIMPSGYQKLTSKD